MMKRIIAVVAVVAILARTTITKTMMTTMMMMRLTKVTEYRSTRMFHAHEIVFVRRTSTDTTLLHAPGKYLKKKNTYG